MADSIQNGLGPETPPRPPSMLDAVKVEAYGQPVAEGADLNGLAPDSRTARPGEPTLKLELAVDLGSVEVQR